MEQSRLRQPFLQPILLGTSPKIKLLQFACKYFGFLKRRCSLSAARRPDSWAIEWVAIIDGQSGRVCSGTAIPTLHFFFSRSPISADGAGSISILLSFCTPPTDQCSLRQWPSNGFKGTRVQKKKKKKASFHTKTRQSRQQRRLVSAFSLATTRNVSKAEK